MNEYDDELAHIGVLHKSGRYPWGSGKDPYQRSMGFLQYVDSMRKQGLSDTEIARGIGELDKDGKVFSTTELRVNNRIAKNEVKKADIGRALMLQAKGMSSSAIGRAMDRNESSVRALLQNDADKRISQLEATKNIIKDNVAAKTYLDVGIGNEHHIGVSDTQFRQAVAALREEGYQMYSVNVPQIGTNHDTRQKVLAAPDSTFKEFINNRDKVGIIADYSEDGGSTFKRLVEPKQIDPKRVTIRYGDEGGSKADGVIELRRGIDDISLGNARYAQVRIAVGKDRFLKGMAMYADDLPDGVDIRFNTNKSNTGNKLDAMKPHESDDPTNPFGSTIRQKHYLDSKNKEQLSALNIVNEEGEWKKWSAKLSSQFLSKQPPALAKEQLNIRYGILKTEYEDISKLTNPVVKQKLLQSFSDSVDSSAVHLKAAALPRTRNSVILPIDSLKDTEIYAPKYNNGEKVVLIRHPHAGIFEIPELTVNNRNKDAKRFIQNAEDAVGINAKVAFRLSGADFDGDTVLVIPNDRGRVKTSPTLPELKNFDPQTAYPKYDGMKLMSKADKQHKMGDISNLITDMTIRGATNAEMARAVKHSMVVIDAEKHKLNHKQSYIDNGIKELKVRYQGSARKGATTLISRSNAREDVPLRKPRAAAEGGPIDRATGERKYTPTGETRIKRTVSKRTGEVREEEVLRTFKSKQGVETNNAYDLSSGRPIEAVYADYSNQMKALANMARKEMVNTKPRPVSLSAKEVYKDEVATLKAHLNRALKNAPLERQAQVIANAQIKMKVASNPDMEADDYKRVSRDAIKDARSRVGAKKLLVPVSDKEWEAIQAGAVSTNVLEKILTHTDLDRIKELATPRTKLVMDGGKLARAHSMLNSGYTQAEVAAALGVSVSTLEKAVSPN